ncbi:hypothetical protein ACHAXT_012944 [Thalassiosira profunda]
MAKSTRASAGKAKKAGATSAKARKSKSPAKKAAGGGIVSIEACKQNDCGASVEINKEKPGRGNFIVRVEGKEEPVLELVGMKRPFKSLRALDMEDIGKLVVEALEE